MKRLWVFCVVFCFGAINGGTVRITNNSDHPVWARINQNKRVYNSEEVHKARRTGRIIRGVTSLGTKELVYRALQSFPHFQLIKPKQSLNFNNGVLPIKVVTFIKAGPHKVITGPAKKVLDYVDEYSKAYGNMVEKGYLRRFLVSPYYGDRSEYDIKPSKPWRSMDKETDPASVTIPMLEISSVSPQIKATTIGAKMSYNGPDDIRRDNKKLAVKHVPMISFEK